LKTIKQYNEHINAKTIKEAVAALTKDKAMACAGGTDLLTTLRFEILPDDLYPQTVVNLKTISPSLDYIKEEDGILKIGALTRLEDIAQSSVIQSKWTALSQAASRVGSHHIREIGTIGGNICQYVRCWYFRAADNRFYCNRKGGNGCFAFRGDNRFHSIFGALGRCLAVNPSDIAPALVVLNATIVTYNRKIVAENFWSVEKPGSTVLSSGTPGKSTGVIVTEIQVPAPAIGTKSAFIKYAYRKSIDFPIVNCAAAISSSDAKICLNAVYNIPYRAVLAEDVIRGHTINESLAEAAGEAVITGPDIVVLPGTGTHPGNNSNPGNAWKIQVAKTLVKRTILACK